MERRLQLLRRAVKIRADGEEEKLEKLTTKWQSVGRELAWELWAVVREQGQHDRWGVEVGKSDFRGQKRDWGWDDTTVPGKGKNGTGFEANWGFADSDMNQPARYGEETLDESGTWTSPSPTKLEAELWKTIRKTTKKPLRLHPDLRAAGDLSGHKGELSTSEGENCKASSSRQREEEEIDETTETRENTLGTMLRQFGIADETLGWNEDDGDFVAPS